MEIIDRRKLEKLKRKNRGNTKLIKAIDDLIEVINNATWQNPLELKEQRGDADCVHSDGFYFFNIAIHRTLVLVLFEDQEATIVWAGDHQKYEETFKNSKDTIEKWLRDNDWIN